THRINDSRPHIRSGRPARVSGIQLIGRTTGDEAAQGAASFSFGVTANPVRTARRGRDGDHRVFLALRSSCAPARKCCTGAAHNRKHSGLRPMNALTSCIAYLSESLSRDPLLLLASAVATFDPYWIAHDEEEYEEDPLQVALRVTRDAFPDIYAQAIERLRIDSAYEDVDRFICNAITAKGIPVDDLYMIGWGIPLSAFGAGLTEPEFYQAHPDLLPVLS